MDSVTADSFAGLVAIALERMAFVVADPAPDAAPAALLDECPAHAIVELRGAENYTLAVGATAGMVRDVASGMMGVEPEEIAAHDHARATVDELANVLAGELAMLLTGGDAAVRLSLPRAAAAAEVRTVLDGVAADGLCAVLASECGRLLLVVRHDADG